MRSSSRLAIFKPAPLRKRLWQGAIALAVFISSLAIGSMLIERDEAIGKQMRGLDFVPFYCAATLVRTGHPEKLYDLQTIRLMERDISANNGLELGKGFGPFWNPPFYALMLSPLARFPYRAALAIWTLLNVLALIIAIDLIRRMLGDHSDWRTTALVPLLILVSMPFIQAISHGQNTFMSLMLLAMMVTSWRANRPVIAGAICGLLLYKPQLAVVIAAMCTLSLGRRVLIGLIPVGLFLLGMTLLTMPNSIPDYLHQLPNNLRAMQVENTYMWERHVTLKGFFRILFQGRAAGEISPWVTLLTTTSSAMLIGGLIAAWNRAQQRGADDVFSGIL